MIIINIILKFLIFMLPLIKANNNNNFLNCINNINNDYFTNIEGCYYDPNDDLHCYNYTISKEKMKDVIYKELTFLLDAKCDLPNSYCDYNWDVIGNLSYNSTKIGNARLFAKYKNLTTYDYIKTSINQLSSGCIGDKQGYFNDTNLILCYDINNSDTNICDFY